MRNKVKMFWALVICLCSKSSMAQTNPAITSWLQNTSQTGTYYVSGNSTAINNNIPVNCQLIQYSASWVYVTTNGIPAYPTGPFLDGNPSVASDQNAIYKISLNPTVNTGSATATTGGNIGVFINGVSLFDYRDGVAWNTTTNSLCGGPGNPPCPGGMGSSQAWNRDAIPAEKAGFDCAKGHPAMGNYHHHQNPSAFDLDLNVISTICNLYDSDGLYAINPALHSPLIGFAYDGFPIYGAYGYNNTDGSGAIVRIKSGYQLRNITVRTHHADGTDVADGPAVSATYPLGYFREDYEYIAHPNDPSYLDVHNGRFCVTPEYPEGIYCYFATVDENHNSAYPYIIGPTFYGNVTGSKVSSVTEAVTTYTAAVSVAIVASDNGICAGTNVNFTASALNGGINPTYQWKKNNVNVGSNTPTYTDSNLANNDVVFCIITTSGSNTATSNSIVMTVYPSVIPQVAISIANTTLCTGAMANFYAAATNGGTSPQYEWTLNGTAVGTNSSSYTSHTLADGDMINCMITSNANCANPATAAATAITMNIIPLPTVQISASTSPICADTPVTYTATTSNAGTNPVFVWKKNGLVVGTNSNTYMDNNPADGDMITCDVTYN